MSEYFRPPQLLFPLPTLRNEMEMVVWKLNEQFDLGRRDLLRTMHVFTTHRNGNGNFGGGRIFVDDRWKCENS